MNINELSMSEVIHLTEKSIAYFLFTDQMLGTLLKFVRIIWGRLLCSC